MQEMAADAYMWRRLQSRAAEADGWVGTTSRWTAFHAGRGGGEQVQEIGDTRTNATDGGW